MLPVHVFHEQRGLAQALHGLKVLWWSCENPADLQHSRAAKGIAHAQANPAKSVCSETRDILTENFKAAV